MKSFLLILSASLVLVGCSGLTDLAQNSLYPFEEVEKNNPSPPIGQGYYPEIDLDGIHGYIHRSPASRSKYVVVYLQGNGENLPAIVPILNVFNTLDLSFVAIDYPGMGHSKGIPSEETLVKAAKSAIAFARINFPDDELILWGRSLGAGVALQAYGPMVNKLIITSGWTSFERAAKDLSPLGRFISKEFIEKNKYDSLTAIKKVGVHTLIMHGTKDKIIPFQHGKDLAYASVADTVFLPLEGKGHNDVFTDSFWDIIQNFLTK